MVFSRSEPASGLSEKVEELKIDWVTADPSKYLQDLKARSRSDIWLVGGGNLNASFLEAGLVDEIILTVIPVLIGRGTGLTGSGPFRNDSHWSLVSERGYPSGLVQLYYRKADAGITQASETPATDKSAAHDRLSQDQKVRYAALRTELAQLNDAFTILELPGGFRFQYEDRDGLMIKLAEYMTLERIRCPFFRFDLTVGASPGIVSVALTVDDPGAKEKLRAELEL